MLLFIKKNIALICVAVSSFLVISGVSTAALVSVAQNHNKTNTEISDNNENVDGVLDIAEVDADDDEKKQHDQKKNDQKKSDQKKEETEKSTAGTVVQNIYTTSSKNAGSNSVESKQASPKVESLKSEEPKSEEPKPEEPKPEEPKPEEPKPEEPKPEEPKPEDPDPSADVEIFLSGNPEDVLTFDNYTYYVGDRYILYFEKGATIRGDMGLKMDMVMRDLEELYGLEYSNVNNPYIEDDDWREFYLDSHYMNVNTDLSKINIMIIKDVQDGTIQCASTNVVKLFDTDFEPDSENLETVYHEMAHCLRLHQSQYMGGIFEEGVGVYAQYHMGIKNNLPVWSVIQYIDSETFVSGFDDSEIVEDPIGTFRKYNNSYGDPLEPHYQYGIRLVTFLREEYGPDVIKDISEIATNYDLSYDDTEAEIEILKEATSEDVFERFAEWIPENWDKQTAEYVEYMQKYGLYD